MLSEHIEDALGGALTVPALEEIARTVWRAVEAGSLGWEEAGRLDGLVRARRAALGAGGGAMRALGVLPGAVRRPHRPRSPDRAASVERRRRVASSGALPPGPAGWLTEGQRAILTVVGREAARGVPSCDWPVAKIAALAGVCRSTVQGALRLAERLGLIRVRQRRRRGAKSDTNVVTVEDRSWWQWLRRGPRRAAGDPATSSEGGGSKRSGPTNTEELRRGGKTAETSEGAAREGREEPREEAEARPEARRGTRGPSRGLDEGG